LIQYVRQPVARTARNRRYLSLADRTLDGSLLGLDIPWLREGEVEGYRARQQTNTIGRLAFCWHTPGLSTHRSDEVLEALRLAYLGVSDHVTSDGRFVWPMDKDMYWAGSHEHAWRLEPLLVGYIWVGEHFPQPDRDRIVPALRRAADWLASNPCSQLNNRGAVWCAVTTLCGLYFDEPSMCATAGTWANSVMEGVVLGNGEVGEHTEQYVGGGPCTNYTYTGLGYVYLYWLLSGRADLTDRLRNAVRWLALYNTLSGHPVAAGASVRVVTPNPPLQDALPLMERFSREDPFLATVAERWLDRQAREGQPFGGHIISPLIWAMFESGVESPDGGPPRWYTHATRVHDHPAVHYALLGRSFQTGVTFRARPGPYRDLPEEGAHLRGVQTFALGDEPPILFHGRQSSSGTLADGVDTAVTDVSRGPEGWEVQVTGGAPADGTAPPLLAVVERRQSLWTVYALTARTLLVVYGGADGTLTTRWALYPDPNTEPRLDPSGRTVCLPGRVARLSALHAGGSLRPAAEDRWTFEVAAPPPLSAFAFSDASFRCLDLGFPTGPVRFTDGSGSYCLDLADVCTQAGDLDRAAGLRLRRTDSSGGHTHCH